MAIKDYQPRNFYQARLDRLIKYRIQLENQLSKVDEKIGFYQKRLREIDELKTYTRNDL